MHTRFSTTIHPGCILSTHTHTYILQVQADSAQYLGGYSGEGGALRDVFGYLESLYPQGSKHQLLLGRTNGGVGGWRCGDRGMMGG